MKSLLGDVITTLKTVMFIFQNTVRKKVASLMSIANCLVEAQILKTAEEVCVIQLGLL